MCDPISKAFHALRCIRYENTSDIALKIVQYLA